jgi:hypothetical protein
MFKQMLITTVVFSSLAANAESDIDVSLNCKSRKATQFESVEVKASFIFGDWMKAVVVTVVDLDHNDKPITTVGRAQQLNSDRDYKPRKYKNHIRFSLSNLTETKDFGKFYPGDMCSLSLMIPKDVPRPGKFEAPMVVNCDQSGGSMTLDCETIKRD